MTDKEALKFFELCRTIEDGRYTGELTQATQRAILAAGNELIKTAAWPWDQQPPFTGEKIDKAR